MAVQGRIYLRTLGDATLQRIDHNDSATTLLSSSKLLALLTYLNAAPGRSATRDHLVHLLWSDLGEDPGRRALRNHLWQIKDRLDDIIPIDRGTTLTLRDPIPSDRNDLLEAASGGDLLRVVSIYRGDFFPEFAGVGAQEFELWVERERTSLRSLFVRSGHIVVKQWLDLGRTRDSVALAKRVREADRFDQSGWRLLLETLIAAQDRVTAAVEADAFERFAEDEELDLESASLAVVESVKRPSTAQPNHEKRVALLPRELVGREAEFAMLVRAWDLASRGRFQGVHLTAPAGMGKTRLLHEFAARLISMRVTAVSVKANWASRNLSWSFLSDLISRLVQMRGASGVSLPTASILTGLAPSAASVFRGSTLVPDRSAEAVARRGALIELLSTLAHESPLALLIDDLHWCDSVSREILLSALESVEKSRLLVVLAERDYPHSTVSRTYRSLPLAPLSLQAVTTFVGSVARFPNKGWEGELCERLASRVGGLPLHLLETLQLALQRGALRVASGTWELVDQQALQTLLVAGEAMRIRLEALPQEARQIVDLFASIGMPLPKAALVECYVGSAESLEALLDSLEHSGIIRIAHEGIVLSHDEFAEVARDRLSEDQRRIASQRAGDALATVATDRAMMISAASLMHRENAPRLRELFKRYLELSRREGDARTARQLARELLGNTGSELELRALVHGLTIRQRTGLDLPKRRRSVAGGAALMLLLLVVSAGLRWSRQTPSGVVLVAQTIDSSGARVLQNYNLPDNWARGEGPLVLLPMGRPVRVALTGVLSVTTPPHDTLPYLVVRDAGDAGGHDLYEYYTDGRLKRLSQAPGDDLGPSWSPDGTMIAFATARWDSLGRTDIAIFHRRTGLVQPVTSSSGVETNARWSPDGTRIAYNWSGVESRSAACVLHADGTHQRCFEVFGALIGWRDDVSLLVKSRHESVADSSEILDAITGLRSPFTSARGSYNSDDGTSRTGLVLCRCSGSLGRVQEWSVQSVSNPASIRQVAFGDNTRPIKHIEPVPRNAPDEWVESLSVSERVEVLERVPYRLEVTARRADGLTVLPRALTWTSEDHDVVSVNESGNVIGLRAGDSTNLVVSAGGWRSRSVRIVVRDVAPSQLMSETWVDGTGPRWVAYGLPKPDTVRHPDRTLALSNRGDGSFDSGIYSAERFSLHGGLALRAKLAGRVTMEQWQTQRVSLAPGLNEAALGRWDHESGYLASDGRVISQGGCTIQYPGGPEGPDFAKYLVAGDEHTRDFSLTLAQGHWYEVVLQVLPDRRCVVMLNGRVVSVGWAVSRADSVNVVIEGSSVRTNMMVGPLEVWRGVLPEVLRGLAAFQAGTVKVGSASPTAR